MRMDIVFEMFFFYFISPDKTVLNKIEKSFNFRRISVKQLVLRESFNHL